MTLRPRSLVIGVALLAPAAAFTAACGTSERPAAQPTHNAAAPAAAAVRPALQSQLRKVVAAGAPRRDRPRQRRPSRPAPCRGCRRHAQRARPAPDGPLPRREHHEVVRGDRRAPARRRGQAFADRHGRAPASRHPALRRPRHRAPAAEPHERCSRQPGPGPGRVDQRQPDPPVVAARARGAGRRQATGLRARHRLGLLEHQLHAGRPDHRACDRPPPRRRAPAGASSDRCTCATRPSR